MGSRFTFLKLALLLWILRIRSKIIYCFHGRIKFRINKSILYLENFPIENAGYQYRSAKWAELLRNEGYQVDIWTLCKDKLEFDNWFIKDSTRISFLTFALKLRFKQVLASRQYETVIVRRELLWFNDYGNLFLDKLLLKFHPNAILDFDDDISAAKNQPKKITNCLAKLLSENGNKFNDSLRLYKKFIVASKYLKEKVLHENQFLYESEVCVIPTCVDYDKYLSKEYPEKVKKYVFGWIGGDHNYSQLDLILPILDKLSTSYSFKLLVIGGTDYKRKVNFEIEFRPWTLKSEINDLYSIDVGLMPLLKNRSTKGKGGFKLLQYMGLGIVSVASAITINKEIVEDGVNSFLCDTEKDWQDRLENILLDRIALTEMGKKAKNSIADRFTFTSNKNIYINFINTSNG